MTPVGGGAGTVAEREETNKKIAPRGGWGGMGGTAPLPLLIDYFMTTSIGKGE